MSSLEQTECPECNQIVHYQPQRWKAQVVCSNCQATFPVEAVNPPSLPNADASPIPSHLQGTAQPPGGPEESPSSESGVETFRYRRSKFGSMITVAILLTLLAAGVVGGITWLAMYDSSTKNQQSEKSEEERKEEVKKKAITAGKKRAKLGNLEVGVKLVEYGPLRVKDQTNKVHISSDPLLQIHLEIRSRNPRSVDYVSWYGNSFERGDSQVVAELTDQNGDVCDMPVFGDVKGLFGHTAKATIEKNERVQDCVVFELPAGKTITDIKELYLTLPMECFGNQGEIHFKIPAEMIALVSDQ